ncbi:MAG: hypothetical protein KGS45_00080 [Planctomycetes bacterium]|nr:hypothetical protein [Planctomycetota bacterium]
MARRLTLSIMLAAVAAPAVAQSPTTGNTAPWTGGGPPSNPDPTKFPTPQQPPAQQLPSRPPQQPVQPSPGQPLPRPRLDRPVVIYPSRPHHHHNNIETFGWYGWDNNYYGHTRHGYNHYGSSRRFYDAMGNLCTYEYRSSRPYPSRGWTWDGTYWYRVVRVGGGLSFGGSGPDPSVNYYGVSPNVSNGPYTQYVGSDGRTYISVPTDPAPAVPTTYDHALDAVRAKQTTQAIKELNKHLKELAADSAASPDFRAERLLAVMYLENAEFSEAMSRLALAYRRMPTLANEPIDAADLGIESARLRDLVVKAVRYSNRMNTGSSWLMVTILMQAEGRTDLALANLNKAEAVGLDPKLVAVLRNAMTPVQDPPAIDPVGTTPTTPLPSSAPTTPPNTGSTPAPKDRQE